MDMTCHVKYAMAKDESKYRHQSGRPITCQSVSTSKKSSRWQRSRTMKLLHHSAAALSLLLLLSLVLTGTKAWEATWESLDSRPNPAWYDESKFGIFIHWGVFSVPAWGFGPGQGDAGSAEWFWWWWQGSNKKPEYEEFVRKTEHENFAYADYAHRFDASLYRPEEWADLFAQSGAQYVVLTAKHHEGFCNWDSKEAVPLSWNWNSVDVGPRRDIVAELSKAVKSAKSPTTGQPLHWGLYHSLKEWFNPLYVQDTANDYKTRTFVEEKTMPELYDLVNKYEPELIWSDGDDGADDKRDEYWNAPEFLAWYATNSTVAETAIWNDRWGTNCRHGAFFTCHDRYQPGKLMDKKWENALTPDPHSWAFNRRTNGTQYLSVEYFVHELIETVAFGGNMLLNVGPAADGTIPAIFWDRLLGIGDWLKINGEAIYKTKPWKVAQNQTDVGAYYTTKGGTVYALVTKWPKDNRLILSAPMPTADTQVRMVGLDTDEGYLAWDYVASKEIGSEAGIVIEVPPLTPDVIPCRHAWAFAIRGLQNEYKEEDLDLIRVG